MKFAKIEQGQLRDIRYIGTNIPLVYKNKTVFSPTAADFVAAGYIVVKEEQVPAGKRVASWKVDIVKEDIMVRGEKKTLSQTMIVPVYEDIIEVKIPRTFSKLRVVAALSEIGIWSNVKEWLEINGKYDLFLAAQDFKEDNEFFAPALDQLKAALSIDDITAAAILDKCQI